MTQSPVWMPYTQMKTAAAPVMVERGEGSYLILKDGTKIPFSELPVLSINGESIAQTMAIARICGKLGGMYPEDIVEAGKVDQIVVAVENINALLSPSMKESDPLRKKTMRKELTSNELPTYFGYLQDILYTCITKHYLSFYII